MALTFLEMKQRVAPRVGFNLSRSEQNEMVGDWINETLQHIHNQYDWFWARDRAIVQTVIDKTAGTISITSGATAVVGSGTAFVSADVGKFLQTSDSNDWYRISTFTDTENITIEVAYTGTSDLSGGTYTIRKWFYSLPSTAEKPLIIRQTRSPRLLTPVRYREFFHTLAHPTSTGKARAYIVWGLDSDGYVQFYVYPWPDAVYNLEVPFKKRFVELSEDDDKPDMPDKWRIYVIDGALARAYEHITKNPRDARAMAKNRALREAIEQMKSDADPGASDYHMILDNREAPVSPVAVPRLPEDFSWKDR